MGYLKEQFHVSNWLEADGRFADAVSVCSDMKLGMNARADDR